MKFSQYIRAIRECLSVEDGQRLASLLTVTYGSQADKLTVGLGNDADFNNLQELSYQIEEPWRTIVLSHASALLAYNRQQPVDAFYHQRQVTESFTRWMENESSWALNALIVVLQELRRFAEMADIIIASNLTSSIPFPSQEETGRMINRAFTLCVQDRTNSPHESRKKGIFKVASIGMKCYLKVDRYPLCKNMIVATAMNGNPPLEAYSLADQVTFKYYTGYLAFMRGDERTAEKDLKWAFERCYWAKGVDTGPRHQELILTYLIPLHMSRSVFPSSIILSHFPRLAELYNPFFSAIKQGNVKAYDDALIRGRRRLVDMGSWFSVEKSREVCVRGLFKIVWIASDKSSRIPIASFQLAMSLQGVETELDEVECMVANMIYNGYMKGYISHSLRMVVLAKTNPFPSLSKVPRVV